MWGLGRRPVVVGGGGELEKESRERRALFFFWSTAGGSERERRGRHSFFLQKSNKEKQHLRFLPPPFLFPSLLRFRTRGPCSVSPRVCSLSTAENQPPQQKRKKKKAKEESKGKADAPLARRPCPNRAPPDAPRRRARGRLLGDESPRLFPRGESH